MNFHLTSLVGLVNDDESVRHKLERIIGQQEFKKQNHGKYSCLTSREIEVMKFVVRGNSSPEIANLLFISRYTVEQHRKNVKRKLEIKSVYQLFQFALAFDLV